MKISTDEEENMEKDFIIVDAHVHTYPNQEIARQAIGSAGYGYVGTIPELKEVMAKCKISDVIMANLTPTDEMKKAQMVKLPANLDPEKRRKSIEEIDRKMIERMERRNRWTCETARENKGLWALISVDILQKPEEMVEEVDNKVKHLSAKGLKLHPIANAYYPWDKRLWPVYSRAQELGIPVLFHSGHFEIPGQDDKYGRPNQFEKVASSFPDLKIVLAHIGKGFYEESVEIAKKCPNVFFDTSTCFYQDGRYSKDLIPQIADLIKRIGTYRVMFGSDWAWFDPLKDIESIKAMKLSDNEKAAILGLNAKEVYKL
jgi:predicted TIM-barrel fold metal-dependent hydrolase